MLLTFVIMALSIATTALLSARLFFYIQSNLSFIAEHGADALRDGALMQLFELVGTGIVALACYLLFKACENVLVTRMLSK